MLMFVYSVIEYTSAPIQTMAPIVPIGPLSRSLRINSMYAAAMKSTVARGIFIKSIASMFLDSVESNRILSEEVHILSDFEGTERP